MNGQRRRNRGTTRIRWKTTKRWQGGTGGTQEKKVNTVRSLPLKPSKRGPGPEWHKTPTEQVMPAKAQGWMDGKLLPPRLPTFTLTPHRQKERKEEKLNRETGTRGIAGSRQGTQRREDAEKAMREAASKKKVRCGFSYRFGKYVKWVWFGARRWFSERKWHYVC